MTKDQGQIFNSPVRLYRARPVYMLTSRAGFGLISHQGDGMAVELCILASGSSGNSTVVRTPSGAMLIDAGIGPRTTAKRLCGTGVTVPDLTDICLTHLDHDHFNPSWLGTILRQRIRLHCHARCADELRRCLGGTADDLVVPFDSALSPLPGLQAHAIALRHDAEGSHGFLFEGFGTRVGYATDLGQVPDALIDAFTGTHVLALESNYDPDLQRTSGRPWFLQRRIMGGSGHLSNGQAYAAVCRILDRAQQSGAPLPGHIVLLHRSRQCNCPDLVRRYFSQDPRIAPRLVLAHQSQRTEWLRPRRLPAACGEQLTLAWA